jgi:nucleoside-diphosphate-sugar epimerase
MSNNTTKAATISILGCGWFGLELAKNLIAKGYRVKGSTTSSEKIQTLISNSVDAFLLKVTEDSIDADPRFLETDILIITIPPLRASKEQHTFVGKIKQIIGAVVLQKITKVFFISSTSVYGDENSEVNELTPVDPATDSAKALVAAENLLTHNTSFETNILRFAGLIGPGREPGRFFSGKKNIANGQAPVNLIHLNDCVNLCTKILERNIIGQLFNICSPDHPQKQTFYREASFKIQMPAPEFKDELLNWKIVSGSKISNLFNYTYHNLKLEYLA